MARGRKPTPTHLKLVKGNPGRRKVNKEEPVPEGEVVRPKFLRGRAARIWNDYAPQLVALRVLTAVDVHTFATWCSLAAEFERDPAGMNASRISQMRGIAASFGMEASARARLGVQWGTNAGKPTAADDEKRDPASKYFGS